MFADRLRHLRRTGPDRRSDSAGRKRSHQLDAVSGARASRSIRTRSSRTSSTTRTTARSSRAPTRTTTRFRSASTSTPRRCSGSCRAACRATAAYVGSQGRNLFLRSVANQTSSGPDQSEPGERRRSSIREFSIVRCATPRGNITGVQNPYAEVDYKTSGGHDSYNALQLSLNTPLVARR